jgi:hypothetical protein
MKRVALTLILLAGCAGSALAADSPFAGNWKLNVEKSKLTGDTLTYSATSSGYHYSNGATLDYDFAADGKDYPLIADRTVAWTKSGENAWDMVIKNGKGTVLSKSHRVLSEDGKRLTITYTSYRPDGTTGEGTDEYVRVSGGKGLAGKWKDVKSKETSTSMTIAVPAPGQVSIEYPSYKRTIAGPADGTPIAVNGPTVPTGLFRSYKATGPHKWSYTTTLNAKVWRNGVLTVSADGKTLTDASWVPGKASEKEVDVYERQ